MDLRDFAAMKQVFCKDAVLDDTEAYYYTPLGGEPIGSIGPVHRGRDEIMDFIETAISRFTSCHHGHCHEIIIDSETEAHGVIAMQDFIRAPDRKTVLIEANGHYWEKYSFEDGAWRIAETKLTRLFSDTRGDSVDALMDEFAPAKR
jgi:hypothetical protein